MTRLQVLEAMRNGALLHMEWVGGEKSFWIDNPHEKVNKVVAEAVISSDLASGNDCLFWGTPQSWALISGKG